MPDMTFEGDGESRKAFWALERLKSLHEAHESARERWDKWEGMHFTYNFLLTE